MNRKEYLKRSLCLGICSSAVLLPITVRPNRTTCIANVPVPPTKPYLKQHLEGHLRWTWLNHYGVEEKHAILQCI